MNKKDLWVTELANDCGYNPRLLKKIWENNELIKKMTSKCPK